MRYALYRSDSRRWWNVERGWVALRAEATMFSILSFAQLAVSNYFAGDPHVVIRDLKLSEAEA